MGCAVLRVQHREFSVTLTTRSYAEQLGRVLAEAASHELRVGKVWVSTHPGGARLWLITRDIDGRLEYELHGLADVLYDRFNPPDFEVFVMNPRHSSVDIHGAIPRSSVQISMPAR